MGVRVAGLLVLLLVVAQAQEQTLIEILGMKHLLNGLAIIRHSRDPFGDPSRAYMLDPRVNVFLRQFSTRTTFCDYKCPSFFHVPCFLLFGCNIQIRNFLLLFLIPIAIILISGACCGRRIWRFQCWMRYLGVFTGVAVLLWFGRRIARASAVRKRRKDRVKDKQKKDQVQGKGKDGFEIQPPLTADRLGTG